MNYSFKYLILTIAALQLRLSTNVEAFAPKFGRNPSLETRTTTTTLYFNDKSENTSNNRKPSWWSSSSSSSSSSSNHNDESEESSARKQQEKARFAQDKELESLRADIHQLGLNLKWSLATDDLMRIVALKRSIEKAERRDPERVYIKALERIAGAGKYNTRKKYAIIMKYTKEAKAARQCIPRLNMNGLWVANFGEGSELVNVTYSGDTLTAYRIKGKSSGEDVPVLFEADLSPQVEPASSLSPIQLEKSTASKWGVDKLERYSGQGCHPSGKKSQAGDFVDGNLIMFHGYFSFLWIPTRQHVFFSRPTPDMVLRLMRDIISEEDEISNEREHVSKCFEKNIDEAFIGPSVTRPSEPFRRIAREADLQWAKEETLIIYKEFDVHAIPQSADASSIKSQQSFWQFHKWLNYIDQSADASSIKSQQSFWDFHKWF